MEPERHWFFFARNLFDTSLKDAYQTLKQKNKLFNSFGSILLKSFVLKSKHYKKAILYIPTFLVGMLCLM